MVLARPFRLATAAVAAVLLGSVAANTGHPKSVVLDSLKNNNGRTIATWAQPLWHLGPECGNWPCYPTSATRPDGSITPDGKRYPWPRFDSKPDQGTPSCPWPGNGGSDSTPFPTYFAVSKCSDNDVRVMYGIFFTKDGVSNPSGGHSYDWEWAVVNWKLNQQDNNFYRNRIILSRHKKRVYVDWGSITSTYDNNDDINNNNQKNRNHPKLYIGTSHHAIFHKPSVGPGTCDVLSDLDDNVNDGANVAHRGDKWYYVPQKEFLIDAANNTALGRKIQDYAPFSGFSRPPDFQTYYLCGL